MAAELGADVIKTAFPHDADINDFKKIIDSSFVPVVVLGGAAMGDDEALLKMVKMAMDSGASGIAVGRNVFQHENPALVAKSLHAIVHEDASLDQALNILNKSLEGNRLIFRFECQCFNYNILHWHISIRTRI